MLRVKNSSLSICVKGSILNSPTQLNNLARKAKWLIRKPRKLQPIHLVHGLLHAVLEGGCSFRLLASSIGMRLDKKRDADGGGFDTISKAALWDRVGPGAVEFLKAVLAKMMGDIIPKRHELPAIPNITRIIVEDSSIINLDSSLAEELPATRNQHAAGAGFRLQAAFDLVTGDPVRLDLTKYLRNDRSAASDIIPLLRAGDLLIRDLGYFASKPFTAIREQGAHYLSRYLIGGVLHHQTPEGEGERMDLLKYLRKHAPRTGDVIDINVAIGGGQKGNRFHSRLAARRVPKAVEKKRLIRLAENEKRLGRSYSAGRRKLLGWEIYITSLPREEVSADKVFELYPLRWRIETIFKACKSHTPMMAIASHQSNANHVQMLIYAWFCTLVLATQTGAFALAVECCPAELEANYLSLEKVVPKVFEMMRAIMTVCAAPRSEFMGRWLCQMSYHDRYEKRKKRINMATKLEEALDLMPSKLGLDAVPELLKSMR